VSSVGVGVYPEEVLEVNLSAQSSVGM
jgi:hypothetical protein